MSTMYDTSTIGTPTNSITFNDYSHSPIFRVKQTIPQKREIREQDAIIPEGMGVEDYDSFEGKSYFVISGTMYPKTEDEYYRGRAQLRKLASLTVEQSDPSANVGYVPYVWNEAGRGRQMFVKIMYVDGLGESTKQGFVQPFSLYCKIEYPAIFGTTVKSATLNTSQTITNSGGAEIPAYIPLAIGSTSTRGGTVLPITLPVILGASSAVAGGTVVNSGDIASYPTIQIYGPVSSPVITNTTTGEYLGFNTTIPAGQSATLTYNQSAVSLLDGNGNSMYSLMTTGSTLLQVHPGTNNFTLSGSSLGSNAYATVNFLDAFPMS